MEGIQIFVNYVAGSLRKLFLRAPMIVGRCALVCLLMVAFCSCSVEDERDECCDGVLLLYRSVPMNKDLFREHIQPELGLRHFLFDAKGVFVKEVLSNPSHPQKLRLRRLAAGKYTMVTIANSSQERTQLTQLEPQKSLLSHFMLRVLPEGVKGSSDELFWNVRSFEVQRGLLRTYYCDLANIHCHLTVRVKWEGVPPPMRLRHTIAWSCVVWLRDIHYIHLFAMKSLCLGMIRSPMHPPLHCSKWCITSLCSLMIRHVIG